MLVGWVYADIKSQLKQTMSKEDIMKEIKHSEELINSKVESFSEKLDRLEKTIGEDAKEKKEQHKQTCNKIDLIINRLLDSKKD